MILQEPVEQLRLASFRNRAIHSGYIYIHELRFIEMQFVSGIISGPVIRYTSACQPAPKHVG